MTGGQSKILFCPRRRARFPGLNKRVAGSGSDLCVVCHPTRLPFRSAFSPPPPVGLPPDCCFVAIRRSAAVRGVCPFLLPVRLLSAATRRFAAGLLSRSDPPIRRRSDCLSVSSPGCRLLSGTLHSGAFQFLVPKKRASVAPGPSRTGKGAAMVLRRQWSFGGCGYSVVAALR